MAMSMTSREEMDLLLQNSFYQALLQDGRNMKLPINVREFVRRHLHAACPDGKRFDVKASSYGKMRGFLMVMQNKGLIEFEASNLGHDCITKIDTEHDILKTFSSSEFSQNIKMSKFSKQKEEEQTSEKIDLLIQNCFFQALLDVKETELPINVDTFMHKYVHPVCPDGKKIMMKCSSYKSLPGFLYQMQDCDLIEVEKMPGGIKHITKVNTENEIIRAYKSSEFAQRRNRILLGLEIPVEQKAKMEGTIEIKEFYAVSANVLPFFKLFGKNEGFRLTAKEIRHILKNYVTKNKLQTNNRQIIRMDCVLIHTLFAKEKHANTLNWSKVMDKMLSRMNPCYDIIYPDRKPVHMNGRWKPINASLEKWKFLGEEPEEVTVVRHLDSFGINLREFAQSFSNVSRATATLDGNYVIAQGKQTQHVKSLLEQFQIPLKYAHGFLSKAEKFGL